MPHRHEALQIAANLSLSSALGQTTSALSTKILGYFSDACRIQDLPELRRVQGALCPDAG